MVPPSQVVFSDRHQRPTEQAILSATGPAAPAWRALFEAVHAQHPELSETWSYYDDGKSWLLKVCRKSRTVFWGLVERDSFRVTFYFPERLKAALLDAPLSAACKAELHAHPAKGNLRAVSLRFGPADQVADALTLISLKEKLK